MSYNVVTQEGVRTFEDIDDAGDYAQAVSLRTGEPVKVFHAETGLVAFTVRQPRRTRNENQFQQQGWRFRIKAENEEEKTRLKTSAVAICNLIIDFFDGEVQEMKAAKE